MSHEKIESNIYYDERCTKHPYFVNIMRRGQSLYKKFETLEEAKDARENFIKKFTLQETSHPLVFIQGDQYVIDTAFRKYFDDFEEAEKKANIIQKFMDN